MLLNCVAGGLLILIIIMNRVSTYQIKLAKIVCGGHRNIDSYYVVLRDEKQHMKYISRAMRNDEDNEDEVTGEVEIKPNLLELWNYDKMKLVDRFKIDFKTQARFTWSIYQDNLEISVERSNEWEQEIRNRQRGEEAEAEAASGRQGTALSPAPQRSEAASSKIASNTPSKVIKASQHSYQSKNH
jgi:hypothetical protein